MAMAMAMAAALNVLLSPPSPCSALSGSENLRPRPQFASPIPSLHHHHRRSSIRYTRFENSHGGDEEPEGIDGAFFSGRDLVDDETDEEEDDETESSVDLLIRFLQSLFSKASKRAKKASRSILPLAISPQLVSFAVDGVLLLASLSIVKALLEVVCTIGTSVFVAILFLRVIWAAVSYFQSDGNNFNRGQGSYGTT